MGFFIAYVCGLPLGFVCAAFKKGTWWGRTHSDGSPCADQESEIAILMTVFYPCVFGYLFCQSVLRQSHHIFMSAMNSTIEAMSKTSDWLKNRKQKKVEVPIRRRVSIPEPVVNAGGYRDAAPKPCIACGSPTSLNQDHMEVIEQDNDDREEDDAWEAHNV